MEKINQASRFILATGVIAALVMGVLMPCLAREDEWGMVDGRHAFLIFTLCSSAAFLFFFLIPALAIEAIVRWRLTFIKKSIKISYFMGLVLKAGWVGGIALGLLMFYAAWEHNPQNVFNDYPQHTLYIFISWHIAVFLIFTGLAGVAEGAARLWRFYRR